MELCEFRRLAFLSRSERATLKSTEELRMNRREFTGTVLTYGLLQMLWSRDLFAAEVKPIVGQWFKDLNALGQDLKGQKLKAPSSRWCNSSRLANSLLFT